MTPKCRIVVLDGHTLNPGDLTWDSLTRLGEVTLHERTSPADVVARARSCQVILTNKVPISAEMLAALPDLRYVGVTATGYNIVDTEAARKQGVWVCNVPTYGTRSVAQFTFALLLELCHRVQVHSDAVGQGAWSRCPDFSFTLTPQVELDGKQFGVIGYGRIGAQVAEIARGFGMRVLASSRTAENKPEQPGVTWVDQETLLREADIVSLHCPLTPQTQGLIRHETLALMKPTALLLNTSRGALVVDQDLADALNQGQIAGAGLDVLSEEPPPPDNPLLTARNCVVTPHMAWSTQEARGRLLDISVENIRRYLAGDPQNVVVVGTR